MAPFSTTIAAADQQGAHVGRAGAGHRRDHRIVHAEMARLVEIEDGDIRLLPGRQRTDLRQTEHARAACRCPMHHVLGRHRIGALDGAMGVPGAVHLADHVGGFVGGRAVDAKRDRAAQTGHRVGRRDAGAEAAVRLRTMRHAGAGAGQNADLIGIEMHQMREPHVGSEPVVVGQPVEPAACRGPTGRSRRTHALSDRWLCSRSFIRRAAAIASFNSPGSSDQVGVVGASTTWVRLPGEVS